MDAALEHQGPRRARHELAHRLIAEYAGLIPAGQVLAAVLRADRLLASYHSEPSERTTLCEQLVRRRFSERTDRTGPAHLRLAAS